MRTKKESKSKPPQVEKKVKESKSIPQQTEVTKAPESIPHKKKKIVGHETKTNRWGYFFVAPFIIVFCIFNLWPTLYTFILSFTDLRGLRSDFNFVGGANFIN